MRGPGGVFPNAFLGPTPGNFLKNDFWTPPLLSILYMAVIGYVAEALGPLACPCRNVRPRPYPVIASALAQEIVFLTLKK